MRCRWVFANMALLKYDITGQTFSRLTVIGKDPDKPGQWLCKCQCGNSKSIVSRSLRHGHTTSCGCFDKERRLKHGWSRHRVYWSWHDMTKRCEDPSNKQYHRYGGRGIKICDAWRGDEGLLAFIADMGVPPVGMTLDRVDNDKGYEPGNCRWATSTQQVRNRSNTLKVVNNGVEMSFFEACANEGINYSNCNMYRNKFCLSAQEAFDLYKGRKARGGRRVVSFPAA